MMLLAHIDVVEAKRADWERDPFTLTEEGGYFYARGAIGRQSHGGDLHGLDGPLQARGLPAERDHQAGAHLRRGEPQRLQRRSNTSSRTIASLIDAEFALNEGAGGRLDPATGKYVFNGVQAGEKLYQDYTIEVTNPGGHSSRPVPDNAIYRLAARSANLQTIEFPIEFNDATTRLLRAHVGAHARPGRRRHESRRHRGEDANAIRRLKENPSYNAMLHTTCVATQLERRPRAQRPAPARHGQRQLPHLPRPYAGRNPQELETAIGDSEVKVTLQADPETPSPAPPLTPADPRADREAHQGDVARRAGRPDHGRRRHRRPLPHADRHPDLRRLRHLLRSRDHQRPRPQRARPVKSLMEGRVFLYRLAKMYAGGK